LKTKIKAESVREAENIANVEINQITAWAKEKIRFNEGKSKVMLMTRRKRKEQKDVDIYLNNKPYTSSTQVELFGYNIW
jgi:hypothetical protein